MNRLKNLQQYLTKRINAIGENPTSLAERLGWSKSYLTNMLNGQFRPSRKRCLVLADAFGDDPNIILTLTEFYVPPETDPVIDEYVSRLRSLTKESRQLALEYLDFLKLREDSAL